MDDGRRGGWRAAWAAFRDDEDGSATVESLLWLMTFFGLLTLSTDASFAFFARSEAYRIVANANRAYVLNPTDQTEATVRTALLAAVHAQWPNADATVDVSGGRINSTLTIALNDVIIFDVFKDRTMVVHASHLLEIE